MPVVDGKYYDTDDTSWWDDLIDKLSPKQPRPPPSPAAPGPPAAITPGTPQYKLIQAQDAVRTNPAYAPVPPPDKKTFCNFATCDITKAVGAPMKDLYYGKRYALANEAAQQLPNSTEWHEVPPKDAQNLANQGTLVVGVQPNPHGHGHMVTVRPETMPGLAASLGQAPIVNNVGEQRNVVPAADAFDSTFAPPRYYTPNKR